MATQTKQTTKKAGQARARTKDKANDAGGDGVATALEQLRGIAPLGAKLATSLPARAAVSRLAGHRPSRTRAFMAASAAAIAGAAVTYRLLRSGDEE